MVVKNSMQLLEQFFKNSSSVAENVSLIKLRITWKAKVLFYWYEIFPLIFIVCF